MPKVKVVRTDILRKAEITDMLSHASPQMQALIALSWAFGKRISENLALQKADIYLADNSLFVRYKVLKKRKASAPYLKRLTLKHPAVDYIIDYLNHAKDGPLFPGLTRQLANYYIKKINPQSYMHLFRHSLATEMSEHCFTVQQLMSWFDWENPEIAMNYVQRGPALTKELSDRKW
jgi:integrase